MKVRVYPMGHNKDARHCALPTSDLASGLRPQLRAFAEEWELSADESHLLRVEPLDAEAMALSCWHVPPNDLIGILFCDFLMTPSVVWAMRELSPKRPSSKPGAGDSR